VRLSSGTILPLAFVLWAATGNGPEQNWTNYVRIGAYGLRSDNAAQIVQRAQASGVFGIEVDNDIPGRYESFLQPDEKLKAIRAVAEKAHAAGNRAFVYIAGTECITANADKTQHTLAKDHPDWLQRKLTGEPAVFGGGAAFWIRKGDEDVWVTPFASEWRKIYMQRVRQIAATGIDGIYVDIPYWMTHFDGWEDTWASFDDHTVAAFKSATGLDARKDVKLGDFSDPNFQKWVEFRIQAITDFVREIDQTAKSVNPEIKTIPEIYPGIEEEAPRVGADVYSLYPVVDAIAHEYEFGNGEHLSSLRTPLQWFSYQVGMYSFRAFAQGKATWILNYSWDGDKKVSVPESMMNLAASQVLAGANFWDAPGHSMAGSNDLATRKKIFDWIKTNEKLLYRPRKPVDPIGVYFSPSTRNFFGDEFIRSYRGLLILLMQAHLEFQIVTPRTLANFKGRMLVLPDVRTVDQQEQEGMKNFLGTGAHTLAVSGTDATHLSNAGNILRFPDDPGRTYYAALEKQFGKVTPETQADFLKAVNPSSAIRVEASPEVATSIAEVDGEPHVFLMNFAGLQPGGNQRQTAQSGITISVPMEAGTKGFVVPFLQDKQALKGTREGDRVSFRLPPVEKAAVFGIER